MIQTSLTGSACKVELTHVRNAAGFVAALEQRRFDAILLEYARSLSENRDLLAITKQRWPAIPIIALCGTAAEDQGRAALQEGAADYVLEEQLVRLAATIQRAIANAESRA